MLSRRLYIQDNFRAHPGIEDIEIKSPLFITGLPRTGTTVMHNLASLDPAWRVLLYWELLYPYTREDMPNFEAHAIHLAGQGLKGLYAMKPEFIYRHETRATGPEECFNLIRISFYSIAWANEWYLANYLQWFLQQDMTDSYRYYKKLLKLLLWRKPADHLLLKCPAHLFNVDAIFKVFPDARVIWMHRDPCRSIASGLSLLSVFHDIGDGPDEFIESYMEYFKQSLQKTMALEKSGKHQLKSVSYKKLMEDPVGVIGDIYREFGYTWDSGKAANISKWLGENPQHKHGAHKYNLEKYGFSQADIRARFPDYYDEYGHLL
jgi:hypothetical protein